MLAAYGAGGLLLARLEPEDGFTVWDGAAHRLAGSAGMFGFTAIAEAARNFERALLTGTDPQKPALILEAAAEAAIPEMRERSRIPELA